jgi:DnaJ-domain-containing protein 1
VSTAELIAVIVGVAAGYWLISRVIGAWSASSATAGSSADASGDQAREPSSRGADGLNTEWIRANWHEILGVSPNASIEVIKSAYRLRAHQYHPDKTEGLGPELRVLAERKMQELNVAYAWATRGWRKL